MTKVDKRTQIQAVEKVFTLRKNGVTASSAKELTAGEFNTSVWKLNQWIKIHEPNQTTTNNNKSNDVVVSRRGVNTKGLSDLCDNLFNTMEDLREDRITLKEASAISSLAGNITNIKKLQFAAHKYVNKTTTQGITVDKLLNQ